MAMLDLFAAEDSTHLLQRSNFIDKNCSDCHDDVTIKADLDLIHQSFEPQDTANFDLWTKVHDRVKAGEMPPKKKARPDAAELDCFSERADG